MKETTLNNSNIIVQDERITDLDRIVQDIKQSEEWEVVKIAPFLTPGIGNSCIRNIRPSLSADSDLAFIVMSFPISHRPGMLYAWAAPFSKATTRSHSCRHWRLKRYRNLHLFFTLSAVPAPHTRPFWGSISETVPPVCPRISTHGHIPAQIPR